MFQPLIMDWLMIRPLSVPYKDVCDCKKRRARCGAPTHRHGTNQRRTHRGATLVSLSLVQPLFTFSSAKAAACV
jgi:hypothetical protein